MTTLISPIKSMRSFFLMIALAITILATPALARVYKIDSQGDFDTYKNFTFSPGDQILFKRGKTFYGMFAPQGSGKNGSPIIIDAFGAGAMPVIHANGDVTTEHAAIFLHNIDWWEIHNMEVTNNDGSNLTDPGQIFGIYVLVDNDEKTWEHIHIKDNFIHDISSEDFPEKYRGGIHIHLKKLKNSIFNDVVIQGNKIQNICGVGIGTDSSCDVVDVITKDEIIYENLWTNVYIADNHIDTTGRNNHILRACYKAICERNVYANSSRSSKGHSMFTFGNYGSIIQYNEVYGNVGDEGSDRGAFAAGYNCAYTYIQYNYTHDNMWFCGIMKGKYDNANIYIRYNVTENEKQGIYFYGFEDYNEIKNVNVYGNTHYQRSGLNIEIFADHRTPINTYYANNIFYFEDSTSSWGDNLGNRQNCTFENNHYYNITPPADDLSATTGPLNFENPGAVGQNIDLTSMAALGAYRINGRGIGKDDAFQVPDEGIYKLTHDILGNPIKTSFTDKGAIETVKIEAPAGQLPPVIESEASTSAVLITMAETAKLKVKANDPNDDPLTYTWSKISGPGSVAFTLNGSANADITTASFSDNGTYTLGVAVSDGLFHVASEVTLTYKTVEEGKWYFIENKEASIPRLKHMGTSIPGLVSSKDDSDECKWQFIQLGEAYFIENANGDRLQDGNGGDIPELVAGTTDIRAQWKLKGDSISKQFMITSLGNNSRPRIRTDKSGVPDMNGISSDGENTQWEFVETTAPGSIPPVIDAAASATPATITLPETVSLSVSASDPNGDTLTYTWSKVSGSGTVDFSSNGTDSSSSTTASFSSAGTYSLSVEVSDGENVVSSQMTITVNKAQLISPVQEGVWYFIENKEATIPRLKHIGTSTPGLVAITDDSDDSKWQFIKEGDAWFIENANGDRLQDGNGGDIPELVAETTDIRAQWQLKEGNANNQFMITSLGANNKPRLRTDNTTAPDMNSINSTGGWTQWEFVETTAPTNNSSNNSTVSSVDTSNRLAWFALDTGISDADANLTMTLNEAAITNDTMFGTGALAVTESGQYARILDHTQFNMGGPWASRTVSMWFKLDNINGRQVVYEEGGSGRGFNIYSDNGSLYVGGWDTKKDGNDAETWSGTWHNLGLIPERQWIHVALVLDASNDPTHLTQTAFRAYLNGFHAASGNGMQIYKHSDDTGLGGIAGTTLFHDGTTKGNASFTGHVDDLAIWNRVLTDAELVILGQVSLVNEAPTPKAGSDILQLDKDRNRVESVLLDGSASYDSDGSIDSYEWTSEDGTIIAIEATAQVELAVGLHEITLKVTDNEGLQGQDTLLVHIKDPMAGVVATSSSFQSNNRPENTIDGDLSTRWSTPVDGEYLQYQFPKVETIDSVEIAFYKGDSRMAYFDIAVSTDGITFTMIGSFTSSGKTLELEQFDIGGEKAQYLRLIGRGNSSSAWNSITEVIVNTYP